MNEQKVLNQDEIDALIHGVDVGSVDTDSPATPPKRAPSTFRASRASCAAACPRSR
jgi:flagellar motor switch protein FliM